MNLIGKSGLIQTTLRHKINVLRQRILAGEKLPVLERRLLLTGPPGVGKTELGQELARLAAGDDLAVEKLNGTKVNVETLHHWPHC